MLNCFSREQPDLSTAEISRTTGIPMTTTFRLLTSLSEGRLIERNLDSGKYSIGIALYLLGSLCLSTQDILRAANPVVKTLNDLTNESVFVSVFDKSNIVLVMKEESKHAFRFAHNIGTVLPAYAAAMGKAFLSELTDAEIDELYPDENLIPLTGKTIKTKTELKLEVEQVRNTGVAFAREEGYDGVWAIAALIHGADGRSRATLSIALPTFRIHQDTLDQLAPLVKMGASLISFRLGYQDPENPVHDITDIYAWWHQKPSDLVSQVNTAPRAT